MLPFVGMNVGTLGAGKLSECPKKVTAEGQGDRNGSL